MGNNIQWSRRELKERSKTVLHAHYWRIVLAALLLSTLADGDKTPLNAVESVVQKQTGFVIEKRDTSLPSFSLAGMYKIIREQILDRQYIGNIVVGTAVITAVIIFFVLAFSGMMLSVFVINPLEVGSLRFYNRGFDTKPRFKELFHAFEYKYRNVVSVMCLRDIYTFLWSLLFVIPGIVKSYEYLMLPYILSEHPDMQAKEAFAASRQLMQGQKWNAFVLDLSFLGWAILSGMTFGVLSVFFVGPYRALTFTALYRKLLGGGAIPHNIYYDGMDEETENYWYGLPKNRGTHGGQEEKQEV